MIYFVDSRYVTFGNAAPQINAKEGRVSASVVSYPYDDQKDIVLVNSRAKTALQVVSVEWVTNSPSSKIKLQVIKNIVLQIRENGSLQLRYRNFTFYQKVYSPSCSVQAPGTYSPISGLCESDPVTPIGYDITKGLETQHVCNELEFNSLLGACVERDCGYHGMCKKYPSKKISVIFGGGHPSVSRLRN